MHQWWTEITPIGYGAFIFSKKVAGVGAQLRQWAKSNFGYIKLKKLTLLHDVDSLDLVKESRRLTSVKARNEQDLLENLREIRKQEEIYWKQRFRI